MVQGLIFDFDGLIVETEGPEYQVWQEIYVEHGCPLPLSEWAVCIGSASHGFRPEVHLETLYGQSLDREAIRARARKRFVELAEAQPLLPGVQDYIAEAGRLGLKRGVASSSKHAWVARHLERHGLLSQFDVVRCADDVQRTKPDPELYLAALAALNLRADQAIAVEDSPNGILAAKRAGLFCVAVPNPLTCQLPLEQADLRLTSLAAMPLGELIAHIEQNGASS